MNIMNKDLKLTLEAVNSNIAQQEKLRNMIIKEILNKCPFSIGEEVFLVREWDEYRAKVVIRHIYISAAGDYVYRITGKTKAGQLVSMGIKPNHHIEKITKKPFNYEHTKQRFGRVE